MPIEIVLPALSPTMEKASLAKWLVKKGDAVKVGDLIAEIETDKAVMELEAQNDGVIEAIVIAEGTDDVAVGTVIGLIDEAAETTEGKLADRSDLSGPGPAGAPEVKHRPAPKPPVTGIAPNRTVIDPGPQVKTTNVLPGSVKASPLARRIAAQLAIDIGSIAGSGPHGRIIKADLGAPASRAQPTPVSKAASVAAPAVVPTAVPDIPHEAVKLSNMRKTIARRLTESKQTVPHIYLSVDINLDKLLQLRGDLNKGLEARGVKLTVNDLMIKAQAAALMEVPACNVQFTGDQLIMFKRADISVAVSIPSGLITPIVKLADRKSISAIAIEIKELAVRARDGKLKPEEYQGGTASLSNIGMYGIKQFEAVINPPQGMILAIGAGEKRPYVIDDQLSVATVMSATGSFDHRAIDGADAAAFMQAFKRLVESPLGMVA